MSDLAGLSGLSSSRKCFGRKSRSSSSIADEKDVQVSNGEEETVDYFSQSGFDYRDSSAFSRGSLSYSEEPVSSIFAFGQSQHSNDLMELSKPTPPLRIGSSFDIVASRNQSPASRYSGIGKKMEISEGADWSLGGWSSPLSSFVLGSSHDEKNRYVTSSSEIEEFSQELLPVCEDRARSGRRSSLQSSGQSAGETKSRDTGSVPEQNATNLLDYSDPWEQIGIILSLQKDSPCLSRMDRTSDLSREEEDFQELLAALESDLPPSDIPLDDSVDYTLFAPSSLPVAESSEATKVSSVLDFDIASACAFQEDEDISELMLSDFRGGSGSDHWDSSFKDLSVEILPFSDPAAGLDMGRDEEPLEITDHAIEAAQTPAHTDVVLSVHASNTDVFAHALQLIENNMNESTQASLCMGNSGHETHMQSQATIVPVTASLDDGQPELEEHLGESRWKEDVTLQKEFLSVDTLQGDSSGPHTIEVISYKENILAVPELLKCDGVYQGPCLLSESECSDAEE